MYFVTIYKLGFWEGQDKLLSYFNFCPIFRIPNAALIPNLVEISIMSPESVI